MITFEEFTDQISVATIRAGLKIYNIKNQLETRTLDREFSFCCVPQEFEVPHYTRAVIQFGWDNTMTAESFGGNCALFHGDDIICTHDELDKEPFVELHIKYDFEVEADFKIMMEEINKNTTFNHLVLTIPQVYRSHLFIELSRKNGLDENN